MMTKEMRSFLATLSGAPEPMTRGQVGCVVSRADEAGRRACKRLGYAAQQQRRDGKWGWAITDKGREALAEGE